MSPIMAVHEADTSVHTVAPASMKSDVLLGAEMPPWGDETAVAAGLRKRRAQRDGPQPGGRSANTTRGVMRPTRIPQGAFR